MTITLATSLPAFGQRIQFPQTPNGLRPVDANVYSPSTRPSTAANGSPVMVPLNPATQSGLYPSTGLGSATFDPYSSRQVSQPPVLGTSTFGSAVNPPQGTQGSVYAPGATGYPGFNSATPTLPGAGQSATVGTYQNANPAIYGPGVYPNSNPSALFPGAYPQSGSGSLFGGLFGNWFGGSGSGGAYGQPGTLTLPNLNGPSGPLVLPPGGGR